MVTGTVCRSCGTTLVHTFVDLGMSPMANAFIPADDANRMEPFYPLHVYACHECFLVQLEEFSSPSDLFEEYAYFSSFSDSWLAHAQRYVDDMIERFGIGAAHQVVEIASNDGYLLQYFAQRGVPVLGVEPAANVAAEAERKGIPTVVDFFGAMTAQELTKNDVRADLLVGNNVLAHVPNINDFVAGIKLILAPTGVTTMEFPHLLRLIDENQFDTIYHEHFSYLSLIAVERVFGRHGLTVFDVEELVTHGGSLRIFARHTDEESKSVDERVDAVRASEIDAGLTEVQQYVEFGRRVECVKLELLKFLIAAKQSGKAVVGYGAPAKGNTLLNYCGVRTDLLEYTVDRSPHKQGKLLPGVRIPIHSPDKVRETKPDYVLILPWNLRDEITEQMGFISEWGGQFVVPIPEPRVLSVRS